MENELEQKMICRAMIDDLRKRIHDKNVSLNNNKKKLDNEKMIGKIVVSKAINDDEKKVKLMTELAARLFVLNINIGKSQMVIKPELKRELERLCTLLSDKEVENFIKVFDNFIKCNSENIVKDFNYDLYCIDLLVKQSGLDNETISIGNKKNEVITYGKATDKLKSIEVKTDDISIDYNNKARKNELPIAEQKLISEILNLKNNGLLVYDENASLIIYNVYGIRNAFASRARINEVLDSITNLSLIIGKIDDLNVINIRSYLTKLSVRYSRELDKVSKYLDKYDFYSIINQLYRQEEEKQVLGMARLKMDYYAGLSFELERIKHENPQDKDLIYDLNKKMSSFAVSSGLTSKQLEEASNSGVREYNYEEAIFNEAVDGGKILYKEYLDYCKTVKDKEKLSLTEYVKIFHGIDELDSITQFNGNDGFKM